MNNSGASASVALAGMPVHAGGALPRIALIGEDAIVLDGWANQLRRRYEVRIFEVPERALHRLEVEPFDVFVLDMDFRDEKALGILRRLRRAQPATEAIVVSEVATPEAVVSVMRLGASDFLSRPLPSDALTRRIDDAVARAEIAAPLDDRPGAAAAMLHGESPVMCQVRKLIDRFASSSLPVLILGHSGTGKELAARALHLQSARAAGPFVAVNCAGLTDSLIDSELFGHERGAFTGAQSKRKGLFDSADGGTLFLDEIGDVPLATQVRLLRALQEGEVRPVGATESHRVDVRVISATNIDMKRAVADGRFREDLYYRLCPIKIELPTLRARGRDVLLLAQKLLACSAAQARRRAPQLSKSVSEALLGYDWPGNVRELKSALEYALSLARGETIEIEDLPPSITGDPRRRSDSFVPVPALALAAVPAEVPAPNYAQERRRCMEDFDRKYFDKLLRHAKGNLSEAARHSGVDRSNLRRVLKDLGLDPAEFKPR